MLHLILFIIYISLILMVIFVERKRPTEALLWVVIMICVPYAGTILYLIFGSTAAIKLTAAFRKNKLKNSLTMFICRRRLLLMKTGYPQPIYRFPILIRSIMQVR